MSVQQFALNRAIVAFLMTSKARFMLGDFFLELSLALPELSGEKNRKILSNSGKIATKENHAESLDNLPQNALLAFSAKLVSVGHKTDFNHDLLKAHNETEFTQESRFTVYANDSTIEIEKGYESHMGQTLDSAVLHGLIKLMVKQGKNQKSAQRWKTVKGIYTII